MFTNFVVHVNRVGYEDGLHFWGGSTVFNPSGELIVNAPYQEETMTICEIDLNELHRTRARLPLLRDERTNLVLRELNRIVSDGRSVGR
jgi:predicted amidohydrolase